ncbi:MAG: hypothetical protein Q8L79_03125 [Methylobacter sp.]|uniref:hypothetical protein n=1 Tax=Methylobacter sp. TaxID=2051955 RepID=UPI0027308437|nr:hypothetical protein [Methylobacter sp.]MDP1664093.1 hypothetical protein [Methylobacter sp.]
MIDEKRTPFKAGDYKIEFEQYMSSVGLNNGEYGALLLTAKQMVFEREQQGLITKIIGHCSSEERPNLLYRLRKHSTQ